MLGTRISRVGALGVVLALMTAMLIGVGTAGAITPPWTQSTITVHQAPHVICRANGGSISPNQEADQDLGFTVSYPDGVHQGDSFDIKIRPDVSLYPRDDRSTGVTAVINYIYNQMSGYQLPSGLTINSASLGPINGNVGANPEAGYYVDRANVPHSVISGVGDQPTEGFDPMTLPAAQRLSIPGTAPNAFWNTSTNRVYTTLLGSSTGTTEFKGGSALQGPTVTINVTATASVGSRLKVTLAGQLPGSEPRPYTGGQPGNFSPPPAAAGLTSAATVAPWFSTNGTRWIYGGDTVWTDPTYLNTVDTTAIGIIHVVAKAACAPGYETTGSFPTPPSYYTGPNAIPNGTSPPLTDTYVAQDIDTTPPVIVITSPVDGGHYAAEAGDILAGFDCNDAYGSGDDICTGDVANGAAVDSSAGTHTFTVNAQDLAGNPTSKTVTYTVAGNQNPVANHGPNQTGKKTGDTVTLDGSASADPDGPPVQPLTYTWTQTGGVPVTLSDVHAAKPTFVVPPNPAFVYPHALTFAVTVNDPYGGTNTTADSVSIGVVATTPTLSAVTRAPSGTVFSGDLITLGTTVSNPDGGALSYAWSQFSGRTTTLSSTTAANPTYSLPSSGAAPTTTACTSGSGTTSPTSPNCPRFQVAVTASQTAGGTSATVQLPAHASSLPTRPVANAGTAQVLNAAGGLVTLDGSGSTQAQSHVISYAWSQTGGPAVTLSSTTAQKPTFTAPAGSPSPTTRTFSLTVVDTQSPIAGTGTNGNTSTAATTTVTVAANRVIANAGPDQTGKVAGNLITLDASASTDPNFAPLTYSWSQVANGAPAVTLSSTTAQKPTFTAPPAASPTGYVAEFNVTVTNGGPNAGDTDTTTTPVGITVAASTPSAAVTRTPSGTVFTGDQVTLGATITNPDGTNPADYSYVWSQASGRTTTLSSTTAANPTYTVPSSGGAPTTTACTSGTGTTSATSANCPRFQVVVTKINTGKASATAALAAYASSLPARPVASAGTAQSVKVGSGLVTLDGSGSTQAQGHVISYAWSQTAGPAVTLSSTTAQKPTFSAPNVAANYTFSLTVVDTQSPITGSGTNGNTSTASTVGVTVSNYVSPVASAGSNQIVHVADPVTLNASGSSQADGHTLTYSWSQTAGTSVTLSSSTAVQPTFTAPNAGSTLKFTVTVTDTQNPNPAVASTTSSEVMIAVGDYASPVASSGADQSKLVGAPVTLDASGSSQADGHTLTYSWSQTAGTSVTLSSSTAVQPTFTAPNAGSTLKFTVTVTDTQNPNPALASTTSSEVTIAVGDFASPVASPGIDQTVRRRDVVTLDASGSSQADGHPLTYAWVQTAGSPVTLSDATAIQPTFTAPDSPGSLKFTVTVTDTLNPNPATASTTSAQVQIDVQDYASPVADAGPNQSNVDIGTTVTLDGSLSAQTDGHALTYSWSQVAGPAVTLSSTTAQKPTFIAPTGPATLEFALTVDDTFNTSAPATVFINVNGIHGLDFATQLTGEVKGEAAKSSFVATVSNNGVLSRTIASSGLAVSITRNSVAVPASDYAVTAKSVTLASHKTANFTLVWNHGTTALHAGDVVVVSVCTNQVGDEHPENNCGTVSDPAGPIAVFAWTKQIATLRPSATSTGITTYITNMSSFVVRPIRISENVVLTVRVNGGSAETVAPPTMAPFALNPNLGTKTLSYTWNHPRLTRGDSVEITACAVLPANTAAPTCWTKTVVVS